MDTNLNQKQINNVIVNVDFQESFDQLTEDEKNYLYYLSKACWTGQIIDLFQTSSESPAMFIIFQRFFGSFKNIKDLDGKIKQKQIEPVIYEKFLQYAAKFYSNFGNYTIKKEKFIPEFNAGSIEKNIEIFGNILKLSEKYKDFDGIWTSLGYSIFNKSDADRKIDLEEKDGKNNYYLGLNIKKPQIEDADKLLLSKDISLLNTRIFEYYNNQVIILISSAEKNQINIDEKYILLYGEFFPILTRLNQYLEEAKNLITKHEDKDLIDDYITFIKTGHIGYHRESQKKWVKLNSPIDYNINWNEKNIDPLNRRGLYEGFVGLTDSFYSEKYEKIINLIPQLMEEFPWPKDFIEIKEKVQFKSFEIICFAKKGCPYGKSLPYYKDIRKKEGTKNLLFSNVFPNFKESKENYYFLSKNDKDLISSFGESSIKIKTALKLLLGYDLSKFLKKEKDPETNEFKYNFNKDLKNPLTDKSIIEIEDYYKENETFETKFGDNSIIIDECLATLTSLYLCGNESAQQIFFINKIDLNSSMQTTWLLFFSEVINNLNLYNEKDKTWIHMPTQACWIIMNYIIKEQKESEEIIKIELDKEKNEFHLDINGFLLSDTINDIIKNLFQKLFIYKCTGNAEEAAALIEKYSIIDNEVVLNVKNIVEKNGDNQKLFLFHNLIKENDKVIYKKYENNIEGIIRSNLDRFGEEINNEIYSEWTKYATKFLK